MRDVRVYQDHRRGCRGFSLPELLIVVGIIALLMAIILAPLRQARRQALSTRCAAQLQQVGVGLENALNEYKFYPLWDDGGSPRRYTWIDVLIQRRLLADVRAAYCPEDPRPAPLNSARARNQNVYYPGSKNKPGIDYSYGIGVPLSAGGWSWSAPLAAGSDRRPRRFDGRERFTSQRVLAADGNWSAIYNLSGDALRPGDWSSPTQFDNTVAYRHARYSANILYQDSHVSTLAYRLADDPPINTALTFVWYPGEPLYVGPDDSYQGNWYPNAAPINSTNYSGSIFPREMTPGYYTRNLLWTRIMHK